MEFEEQINTKFLPIGSVVMLKGGKKRVMITGFCAVDSVNSDKVWDYCGCLFPQGYLIANHIAVFDHKQIDRVYSLGLIDQEEIEFKELLEKALKENAEKNKNGNL